jgi:hypothetical protein
MSDKKGKKDYTYKVLLAQYPLHVFSLQRKAYHEFGKAHASKQY